MPLVAVGIDAIIAYLGRMLIWLISTYAGQWVLKCLISLGITVATTTVALPDLLAYVQSQESGMSPLVFQAFGAMGMDVAISMVLSALVANATGKMVLRAISK